MSHACCQGALQSSLAAVFRQITAGQSGPCRLACPVWHQTLAPWPSMIIHKHNKAEWPMPTGLSSLARTLAPWPSAIGHKAQTCQLALHRQMRDRHTNESHMAVVGPSQMEWHHWQACRLSPTYAAASTMTGDTSITHHVGPRPQQGWPVSRPPLPVPLQSRGGGTSATLLDLPEHMPCLTCIQHQPPPASM